MSTSSGGSSSQSAWKVREVQARVEWLRGQLFGPRVPQSAAVRSRKLRGPVQARHAPSLVARHVQILPPQPNFSGASPCQGRRRRHPPPQHQNRGRRPAGAQSRPSPPSLSSSSAPFSLGRGVSGPAGPGPRARLGSPRPPRRPRPQPRTPPPARAQGRPTPAAPPPVLPVESRKEGRRAAEQDRARQAHAPQPHRPDPGNHNQRTLVLGVHRFGELTGHRATAWPRLRHVIRLCLFV